MRLGDSVAYVLSWLFFKGSTNCSCSGRQEELNKLDTFEILKKAKREAKEEKTKIVNTLVQDALNHNYLWSYLCYKHPVSKWLWTKLALMGARLVVSISLFLSNRKTKEE